MTKPLSLILLIAVTCLAQQPPEFEVASIKLNTSGAAAAGAALPPGRLVVTNLPLRFLVEFAYNIPGSKVVGGPDWLRTVRYNVEAKAVGTPSVAQLRLMVQSMLADRLKLAAYREKREAQIYEMILAKSGLKLTPAASGSCRPLDTPLTPGSPPIQDCGQMGLGPGQFNAWGIPMASFASSLSGILGRTVVDRTGVAGNYNIIFRFAMDQSIAPEVAGPPGAADASAPPDPTSPNIFVALEEQLGLKAESAKGQVEMLVIDHAERPTEN